jgi:hypothetical protein
MTYDSMWGFFFYSEKQAKVLREDCSPTTFCITEDGRICQYTEWATTGIKPSGCWDDYIPLGRARYHHSE